MLKPTFETTSTRVFLWQGKDLLKANQDNPEKAIYQLRCRSGPTRVHWWSLKPAGQRAFFALVVMENDKLVEQLSEVIGPIEGGKSAQMHVEFPSTMRGELWIIWTFVSGDQDNPREIEHIAMSKERRSLVVQWQQS